MRKLGLVSAFLGVSVLAPGGLVSSAAAAGCEDCAVRADKMYQTGLYAGALRLYLDAYDASRDPRLLVRIGQSYLELKKPSEGLTRCSDYLKQNPGETGPLRAEAQTCVERANKLLWDQRQTEAPAATSKPLPPPPAPAPATTKPLPPPAPATTKPLPPPPPASARPAPDLVDALLARPERQDPPAAPPPAPLPSPAAPPPAPAAPATPALAASPEPAAPPATAPVESVPRPAAAPAPTVGFESLLNDCYQHESRGQGPQAQACFKRYLTEQPEPAEPVARLNRQLALAAVSALPGKRKNPAMWGAGLTLLLSSWVPSAIFGGLYANNVISGGPTPTGMGREIHYSLLVPVLGPFIESFVFIGTDSSRTDVIKNWAVPWLCASGATQLLGFALFIAGLQERPGPLGLSPSANIRVVPYAAGTGGGVAAMGSF